MSNIFVSSSVYKKCICINKFGEVKKLDKLWYFKYKDHSGIKYDLYSDINPTTENIFIPSEIVFNTFFMDEVEYRDKQIKKIIDN